MNKYNAAFASLVFGLSIGCSGQHRMSEVMTVAFARNFDHTNLKICWEITTKDTEEFRSEFSDFVTKAFEKSVIRFKGWEKCLDDSSDDIRLFVYDDADAKGLAKYMSISKQLVKENGGEFVGSGHPQLRGVTGKEKPSQLVLNRTFLNADPKFLPMIKQLTPNAMHNLSISSSIHELGHSLGLRHEDAHPQKTCSNFHEELGDSIVVSDYNPESFMGRCFYRNFDYESSLLLPNDLDIEGINKLYSGVSSDL